MALEDSFKALLNKIEQDSTAYVRLAVVGQPGAGKSSLINNLLGQKVAETGQETDVTREATEYEWDFQRIVDLPGYGTELFRFDTWLELFHPEQYDAFIYVFKGKLHEDDELLFRELSSWNTERERPLFLVRNFSSDLESDEQRGAIYGEILAKLGTQSLPELYFVDCGRYKLGLEELHRAIAETDFYHVREQRVQQAFREAKKARLAECHEEAKEQISRYAKAAAVNGLNPLPGFDFAVDAGICLKMFNKIRAVYDIEEYDLTRYASIPVAGSLAKLMNVEGVLFLLKNMAGRVVFKTLSKYIPVVGQMAAAYVGHKLAECAGQDYDEKCSRLADEVMQRAIDSRLELPLL